MLYYFVRISSMCHKSYQHQQELFWCHVFYKFKVYCSYSNPGEYAYSRLLSLFVLHETVTQITLNQYVWRLVILSLCSLAMVPWVSSYMGHLVDVHILGISSIFSELLFFLLVSSTYFVFERVCEMGHYEVIEFSSLSKFHKSSMFGSKKDVCCWLMS